MGFVLDTNVYIDAIKDSARAEMLERYYHSFLPFTFLHGIVAQELLAGALDAQGLRILRKSYVEPFERRNRLVVPDFATWKRTGEVISRMCQRNLVSRGGLKHSFVRDVVLAVSCRRFGHTLITGNASDFERITKVEPFDFIPPYPEG